MTYNASVGDNAHLLKRAIYGVTDFSGRSRRTEVIYYWIACALIGTVLDFSVSTFMSFKACLLFSGALHIAFLIPMFAMIVRRLHDQNRSGWWGLLLPISLLLSVPKMVYEFEGDISRAIAHQSTPIGIAATLCAVAISILCLLPGTNGSNLYGPDPRLEES